MVARDPTSDAGCRRHVGPSGPCSSRASENMARNATNRSISSRGVHSSQRCKRGVSVCARSSCSAMANRTLAATTSGTARANCTSSSAGPTGRAWRKSSRSAARYPALARTGAKPGQQPVAGPFRLLQGERPVQCRRAWWRATLRSVARPLITCRAWAVGAEANWGTRPLTAGYPPCNLGG
jgi:hypothetical protein